MSKWYTQHFPAVRLNPAMDAWDYSLNFSSEMLVAGFVVIVAAMNIIGFNPFKQEYTHNDKSLAAKVLSYHNGLNTQLASKQNTISTTVAAKSSFISEAFANNDQNALGLADAATSAPTADGIDDNGITKANPDSIKKLISRQVQVYETKPFDTVYTVAKQFGVSTTTIRETNGLPDHSLKAGWFLVIPPVDGIVVQVTNPDISITDLANKYRANADLIVSYNGLEGPDSEIANNEYIVLPSGRLPEPPKPAPAPARSNNNTAVASRVVTPSITRASFKGTTRFAPGQCTDYVARALPGKVTWRGNANMWAANARAQGVLVNRIPVAGAIIQTNENPRYGHVGYIESVNGTKVTFSEWNYKGPYIKTTRTMDISDSRIKAIIHP